MVGTVIDPEMSDELRVTVVATGLGAREHTAASPTESAVEPPVKLVQRNKNGEIDYGRLDRPTVMRKQAAHGGQALPSESDLDYLDIPAFLRRQAD